MLHGATFLRGAYSNNLANIGGGIFAKADFGRKIPELECLLRRNWQLSASRKPMAGTMAHVLQYKLLTQAVRRRRSRASGRTAFMSAIGGVRAFIAPTLPQELILSLYRLRRVLPDFLKQFMNTIEKPTPQEHHIFHCHRGESIQTICP